MKYSIINACSDLGVHVDGSDKGPVKISKYFENDVDCISNVFKKDNIQKSLDKNDKAKNLSYVNEFNKRLYNTVIDEIDKRNFPITIGGDHSVVIASALASLSKNKNLGIIWIDSHGDYNNFETTISGNLHGLPFAAITGFENTSKLTEFCNGTYFNCKNSVLVGARDLDDLEIVNLKNAGITVFTSEDIKNYGAKYVMDKAFEIACQDTNQVHVSYDIDVIDPIEAPGVSIPAYNGINVKDANEIMNVIIKNKAYIKSLDLVEFNPDLDKDDKTLKIAVNLLDRFIKEK